MENKAEVFECYMSSLPVEVLTIILQQCECQDILAFASTCKDFRDIVFSNQLLWKNKFKPIVTSYMFESLEKNGDGNWFNELKEFYLLKKRIYKELIAMSPKYYWHCCDITLEDVRNFFDIALSSNVNYFYVIHILQGLVKEVNNYIAKNCAKKPFTMTEIYYAKVVLRHLMHTFLAVKWVKFHMKKELPPEVVVNFFLQWIDSDHMHPDAEVTVKINALVEKVKKILNNLQPRWSSLSVAERIATKVLHEKQVLGAITQVLFHENNMVITVTVNLETLSITEALECNCASFITIAAIYHAVANRCDVACDLVSFPSHLFVEWRDRSDHRHPVVYSVDLGSGEVHPKRRCPFSKTDHVATYKYCPDSLLQYIYSLFNSSMDGVKNWNTQNALHLLNFLGTSHSQTNPYRNFLAYLIGHAHLPAMNIPLDITNLHDEHIELIKSLANLNTPVKPVKKEKFVKKKRVSKVKYAVGMVCCHRKFDYVGVIRAWDQSCDLNYADRMEMELNLQYGIKQPFYFVMAEDQSCRYVAQENIVEITRPVRLVNLEESIAREFTHFDGFAYVANDQKRAEYPDDAHIVDVYRTRCSLKP
ncbi:unnamed protein product [Chilo suppressalis]|uniref:F-box domain-containing protein n=1 Tax=Chilo suppressalis TaxID=168631 RepID=A0ABN8B9R1_CHISP|nr:unnamed protein product [Chilo suppressalis]